MPDSIELIRRTHRVSNSVLLGVLYLQSRCHIHVCAKKVGRKKSMCSFRKSSQLLVSKIFSTRFSECMTSSKSWPACKKSVAALENRDCILVFSIHNMKIEVLEKKCRLDCVQLNWKMICKDLQKKIRRFGSFVANGPALCVIPRWTLELFGWTWKHMFSMRTPNLEELFERKKAFGLINWSKKFFQLLILGPQFL